ncbi:hypothetical protein ABFS82_04G205600 [Erythranthe guttata]
MATSEDRANFKRGIDSITWPRGRSKAQASFGRILHTISAAPDSPGKHPRRIRDGEISVAEGRKRSLLNIDLNVAPPEEVGSESPPPADNGREIRTAAGASGVYGEKSGAGDGDERELNFGRDRIQSHCSKGGTSGFNRFGESAKGIENSNCVAVLEEDEIMDELEIRKTRWNALLEVAENAFREYEEQKPRNKQNRKRGTTTRQLELQLSGELHKAAAAVEKKINTGGQRRRSFADVWYDDHGEVAAAAPVVVRSARGRALAVPNKYRDAVIDAAAEAEFRRFNKSGKSAAVAPTKRKSR